MRESKNRDRRNRETKKEKKRVTIRNRSQLIERAIESLSPLQEAKIMHRALANGAAEIKKPGILCPNCGERYFNSLVCPYCGQNIENAELVYDAQQTSSLGEGKGELEKEEE